MREPCFDPEDDRPSPPRAPHGQRFSRRRVEGPRKRLFLICAAPDAADDEDDITPEMAALMRSFQLLSLAPRERRPEKSCLKQRTGPSSSPSSPSSPSKKKKKKKNKKKHVQFAAELDEYFEIPRVNKELGLQDLGSPDGSGNIEMIDVDWHHAVYLEVTHDPATFHKRYFKAAILSEWMFEE